MEKFLYALIILIDLPNEVIQVPAKLESISKIIDKMDVAIAGPGLGNNGDEILKFLWKKNTISIRCRWYKLASN